MRHGRRLGATWRRIASTAVALTVSTAAAAQCALCKTGLVNSPEGRQMAHGFNRGIVFLLAAPFLIVATFAILIRRARSAQTQAARFGR